jgi:hypothetical protein
VTTSVDAPFCRTRLEVQLPVMIEKTQAEQRGSSFLKVAKKKKKITTEIRVSWNDYCVSVTIIRL